MNEQTQRPSPIFNLERNDKLKVFAIMSAKKSVPEELLKDSFALSILVTYTPAEAVIATNQVLMSKGKNPEEYIVDCMRLMIPVEEIVNIPPPVIEKPRFELAHKTVEEMMIEHARMIFDIVGTKAQKASLEKILEKFMEYTKNNV